MLEDLDLRTTEIMSLFIDQNGLVMAISEVSERERKNVSGRKRETNFISYGQVAKDAFYECENQLFIRAVFTLGKSRTISAECQVL